MKNIILNFSRFLFVVGITILLTFCNKSSYVEGVGFINTNTSVPTSTKGKITFYSINLGTCNGTLDIFVDWADRLGYIEKVSTSIPICGVTTSKASTIELEQGSHYFSISNGCKRYTFNKTITKGQCLLVELQ